MSRAVRSLRGTAGALSATLIAAISHAIGGEQVSLFAIVATAILALPLCVALAGRVGSLWRLVLAVTSSQFLFHWSFSGLGAGAAPFAASGSDGSVPPGSHAAHLVALRSFAPQLAESASPGAVMWISHGLAAILTIALLHRGERAFLAVLRIVSRALPVSRPRAVPVVTPPRLPLADARARLRPQVALGCGISYRGPPLGSFSTN